MTYFYVAIGALFVGYYTLITSSYQKLDSEIFLLILLGYIVSLLWFLSAKGYYFWNINFITLVNDCEVKDLKLKPNRRVYYVFANKKTENNYLNPISGANVSTSKVSILFSYLITIIWGFLLLQKIFETDSFYLIVISGISTLFISFCLGKILKSKIDHFPDLHLDQGKIR